MAAQTDQGAVAAKPAAPNNEFHQPIQRDLGRPDRAAKIFRFAFPPNQLHLHAIPPHEEGRTRRHDTWGAGCGGREAPARARHCRAILGFVLETVSDQSAQDERRYCVRQKRVVLAPVAGVKSAEVFASPTGSRKTVNSPAMEARGIRLQGERAISRQTIAQGRPDALRWTCMLVCALLCAHAHGTAGAARTRLSLRPLSSSRVAIDAKLGRIAPRDREAASAV